MTKHHHRGKSGQGFGKEREAAQSQTAVDDNSIQLRAYQLYTEKGGPALDNWLEAERFLRNNDMAVAGYINEGNPNAQK